VCSGSIPLMHALNLTRMYPSDEYANLQVARPKFQRYGMKAMAGYLFLGGCIGCYTLRSVWFEAKAIKEYSRVNVSPGMHEVFIGSNLALKNLDLSYSS